MYQYRCLLKHKMENQLKGVFVIGRQHSGNTFLTKAIGSSEGFFVDTDENSWFERVPQLKKIESLEQRVELSNKHLLRGKTQLVALRASAISSWAVNHPQASVYDLFQESLKLICNAEDKRYWVLKATSYIFYAEEILQQLSGVKLIYILRNPLDMTASSKKRAPKDLDWLISTNIAWKKGLQIAQRLEKQFPKQFKIVKYEELVAEDAAFKAIYKFLGLPYQATQKNIPVTNTSDNPYSEGTQKGVVQDRVYYFPTVLSKGSIFFALKLAGGTQTIKNIYPDIPVSNSYTYLEKIEGFQIITRMAWFFSKKHFNIFSPLTLNRLIRRVGLMIFGSKI